MLDPIVTNAAGEPALERSLPALSVGPALWDVREPLGHSSDVAPRIEGYQILGPLGRGGMGTVWRAMQLSTRREVAVKLLNSSQFGSERARQRFGREVELAARLRHPNIAAVYDSGLHQGICYYAMELVDGVPLDEYVATHKAPRSQILRLLRSACEAMAYAHQRGVIHRDLKPSNVLVDAEGRVRVVDFGLAKAVVADLAEVLGTASAGPAGSDNPAARFAAPGHAVTLDAEVAGTPAYMSPEQAAGGGSPVDTRSDVYSLGVILYRLLTGRSPHDLAGPMADVMRRVASVDPLDPRLADPTLDRDLRHLLLKALARRPDDRYGSADALGHDIENYLAGEPLTARRPTLTYILAKRLRRHRVPVLGAAALLVFLCAMAIASYRSVLRAGNVAIAARDLAERRQADERRAARDAKVQLAAALVSQGDARAAAGDWNAAKNLFEQAKAIRSALALPSHEFDLALAQADLYAPPPLVTLGVEPQRLTAASIAADNRTAATADASGQVRLWDLPTGRCLRQWSAHAGAVGSLRFGAADATRRWLVSAGTDKIIKIWAWQRGEPALAISIEDQLGQVALSPDGKWLASGSSKGLPRLWRLSQSDGALAAAPVQVEGWAARPLDVLTFSPDSTLLAHGDWMGNLRVLDLSSRTTHQADTGNHPIGALAFSPDGTRLTASYEGGSVVVWINGAKGGVAQRYAALPGAAGSLSTLSAGSSLCAFRYDGSVRLLYGAASEGRTLVLPPHTFAGPAPAISPDGQLVLGNDAQARIVVHDVSIAQRFPLEELTPMNEVSGGWVSAVSRAVTCRGHAGAVISLALSPDRRTLASGGVDHTLRLWDAARGTEVLRVDAPGEVKALAYSPDGRRLLYGSESGVAVLLDTLHPARVERSLTVGEPVTSVAFSPDGRRALVGTDHWVRLWDIDKDSVVHAWHPQVTLAGGAMFSADGRTGMSTTVHGQVLAADLANGLPLPWSAAGPADRRELSTAPASWGDRQRMLAGSGSAVVEWMPERGNEVLRYEGHGGTVRAVAVSAGGDWLVSAANDKTVRVWDRSGGEAREIRTLRPHGARVLCVTLAADANMLASGDQAGTISILDLTAPVRLRAAALRAETARRTLAASPEDAPSLQSLADWYSLAGRPDWSRELRKGPAAATP